MNKNNIDQRLISSMSTLGYSIDMVNMLALSPVDTKRKIGEKMRELYLNHDSSKTIEKIFQMKQKFIREVYGVTNCPFEITTGVYWEDMFLKAHGLQEGFKFKVAHPWFHMAVSSADYKADILYCSKDNTFPRYEMLFYHSGKEMIQIGKERYVYGEALMRMRQFDHDGKTHCIGISHPVFLIDEKLLPELLIQTEYNLVFRLLYTLYHVSSHDGMLHGLFMDSSEAVQAELSKDSVGSRFLGSFDGQCLTYEINYLRLMRHLFELSCKHNVTLKKDVELLYWQICELTRGWPIVLGQYIRFIAFDRISRLINIRPEKIFPVFIELNERETDIGKVFPTDRMKINFLIHQTNESEAILFDGGPPVSYEIMARTMLNVY